MRMPLTKKQHNTLNFLINYNKTFKYMPIVKEVSDYFEITLSSAWERLYSLEKKGSIKRKKFKSRYIIIKK